MAGSPRPLQARSRKTLEKILDGCDRLLEKRSFEQLTMQDIARESGVSVGNLYNRFDDRDALVAHVADRHQRRFFERFVARLEQSERSLDVFGRLRVLAEILQAEMAGLRPVFMMLAGRGNPAGSPSDSDGEGTRARTDSIVETAVGWLGYSFGCGAAPEDEGRCRRVVAALAMQLQFDLMFHTATRLMGDSLLDFLAEQACDHLTRTGLSRGHT